MNDYNLRDLTMAGVQWEITDMPFVLATAAAATATESTHPTNNSAPTRTQTSIVPPIAPTQPLSVDTAVAMAARPTDMDALCRMIAEFNHPLRAAVTNVVLPHRAPNPNGLVIITDIPGTDDDATGQILTGPAGELLDKMLAAIGMSRDNVSILPLLFWRTPGGRTPTASELELARPFVNRVLELLQPRMILTLGTLAAQEIAHVSLSREHDIMIAPGDATPIMPIFHPSYLILKPTAKRDTWGALQQVEKLLKSADK